MYRYVACTDCHGGGCKPGSKPQVCAQCNGSGQTVSRKGFFAFAQSCSSCYGQGFTIPSPCQTCRGQSRVQKHDKFVITIPAGIYDTGELHISGRGDAGIFGGETGNLYLTVTVSTDKYFYRRGNDLATELNLSYPQLVLGCQIEIESLDGSKETIKIPKGCPVGKEIILTGKGFNDLHRRRNGNFVIIPQCHIPKNLTPKAKELLLNYFEVLKTIESSSSSGISGFFKKFLG